jgi:hypothetical protein
MSLYRWPAVRVTAISAALARQAMIAAASAGLVILCLPLHAHAQPDDGEDAQRGRYFVTGSVLTWFTHGATADPPGAGFLRPSFHGLPDSPATGALFNGGVFVARSWSIGGEVALRRALTSAISEETRSKYELWHVTSLYTDRERVMSVIARRHVRPRASVHVQPLGGITVSRSTQALARREGVYQGVGGTLPVRWSDVETGATRPGFVGGADVLVRMSRHASFAGGARLHWVDRRRHARGAPPIPGPFVTYLIAGVRWHPQPN